MDFYDGKSVLITGGSSGIGLALASLLVERNCQVAILSRQAQLLENAAAHLETLRGTKSAAIVTVQADVTKRVQLNQILDDYTLQNGVPDIVINSAGVAHPGTFTSLKPEIFDWMMDVNYFGTVNVLKNLVPKMKERRSGVIVNISSIAGFLGIYGYTAYSASKFAVTGFTDALRSELKPYGINISIVFPPDTHTPQLDYEKKYKPFVTQQVAGSAKLMSADAVAKEIIKSVSRNKYIVLPGFEGKLLYHLKNIVGKNLHPILDNMTKSAIRKIKLG